MNQLASTGKLDLLSYLAMSQLRRLVEEALEEDLGRGDLTTDLLVPPDLRSTAVLRARGPGVIAGLPVVALAFQSVDQSTQCDFLVADGASVIAGQELARISGSTRSLLKAERVALNFVQRLSGTATLTARFVDAIAGSTARIVDTRKTTPGLRALEKYAVRAGGGHNHRRDLGDAVLVKDNHLQALAQGGLTLAEALVAAREELPHTVKIEVEVDRLDQIPAALAAGVDIILLDNMPVGTLREAVQMIGGRAITEASGGITLDTAGPIAATGVDLLSVGALTHSAPALDIALDMDLDPSFGP